jgi:hypothetical protein
MVTISTMLTKSIYDLTNFLQLSRSMIFSSNKLFTLLLLISRCDMFNSNFVREARERLAQMITRSYFPAAQFYCFDGALAAFALALTALVSIIYLCLIFVNKKDEMMLTALGAPKRTQPL